MEPLETLDPGQFETPAVLKKLAASSRRLAELKGLAGSIPNQTILINTLGLQEAKDSSEIENIVTTHDELFKDDVHSEAFANPAAKEVLRYRQALQTIHTVQTIKTVLFDYKHRIRADFRFYSHDLINNPFTHPYTKIEFIQRDLQVSRITATKYFNALVYGGFVVKQKSGRSDYYINHALNQILLQRGQAAP